MPTYENPAADADEAADALRGLAHASRVVAEASDTYRVLGSLLASVASLRQSLDQLADWHERNADRAATDAADVPAGHREAVSAAQCLHRGADQLQHVHHWLNEVFSHNARIAWQTGIETDLGVRGAEYGRPARLAPPTAFGTEINSSHRPDSLGC